MQAHGARASGGRFAAVCLAVGMVGAGAAPPGVNLLPQAEFKEEIQRLPGADSPAGRLHEAETVRYTDTRTTAGGGGSVSAMAANLSTTLGAPLLAVQGMASFSGEQVPGQEVVTATVEVNYWFEVIAGVPSVPIQLPLAWTADGTRSGFGGVMVQWEASITPQINRFRGSDSDGRFFVANTFNGLAGFHDDAASMLTVDAGTAGHDYYKVHLKLTGSAGRGADPFRRGGGGAFSATLDPLPRVDPSFAGAADVRFVFSDNLFAAPVPEPATWALCLVGLLGLGLLRRRRGVPLAVMVVTAWTAMAALVPARAVAAFAQAQVLGVDTPAPSAMDGFGGGNPQAQVLLSGGGPLLPFGDGQGSFILAASAGNARGDLHASVALSTVGQGRAFGSAQASVADTLVIGGNRPVDLELRLAVQGSFSGNGEQASFRATAGLSAGALTSQGTLDWAYSNGAPNPQQQVRLTHTSGDVAGISRAPGNAIVWLTTRQTVTPGTPVSVSAFLQVSADAGENSTALANFGHTAQLWLGLPAGTPFSSRSGVFLTGAPSLPVPEPGSGGLLLAGLGGLAIWWCRRCRPRQPACQAPALVALVAGLGLGWTGSAQAIASAGASSNTFARGLFEQVDIGQPLRAAVALSGAGALITGPGEGSFLATAEADLQRGTLRASAESSTTGRGVTWATAGASFGDQLVFHNTHAITVTLQLAVHGAFDGLGPVAGELNAGLHLGGELLEAQLRWATDADGLPTQAVRLLPTAGGTSATRQVDLRSSLPANTLAVISLTRDIEPGRMLSVSGWMDAGARAGNNAIASVSFGNTAQLSLLVPDGVTYTSASGQFLSAAPVPEPGAAWLLLAGLPLLALRQRRCG